MQSMVEFRVQVVRRNDKSGFYLNVTYRDFNSPMLQTIIGNSESCYQTVRYDCKKVQLG